MTVNPGGRRLRQWLIEQINSNSYPGLLWEDESRTMFRIPWKHAGKQDYNQEVDASIFKAWATFKGKFKEGDKAEPATWKTRLRCALNKSPDFEEVTDRSQLDISEPYKVYRIIPEEEQKCKTTSMLHGNPSEVTDMDCSSTEVEDFVKESSKEDYISNIKMSPLPSQDSSRIQSTLGLQVHLQPGSIDPAFSALTIHFFYGGKMAGSILCTHPEGCRISPQQMPVLNEGTPNPNSMQSVSFPPVEVVEGERQRQVTRKLFGHLERGVLLRASREGIFIKRLCQSRVFWSGLYSQYSPGPCKLERDAIVKIFDTSRFLQALQLFHDGQYLAPDPTITLCFGEEFHDVNSTKSKLIIVQIIPTHWQQLVDTHSSRRLVQLGPNLDLSEEIQNEQIANIFHDLCSYTIPHPCYWENQPITV